MKISTSCGSRAPPRRLRFRSSYTEMSVIGGLYSSVIPSRRNAATDPLRMCDGLSFLRWGIADRNACGHLVERRARFSDGAGDREESGTRMSGDVDRVRTTPSD